MNNLDKSIKDLKEYLFNEELIKHYLELKKVVNDSKEINNILNEISYIKKCDMSTEEKSRVKYLNRILNENIFYKGYKETEDNVKNILNEIKKEILN